MDMRELNEAILRFFREDVGCIRITDAEGEVVFEDEEAAFVSRERTNWAYGCPPLREGQKGEVWDLSRSEAKRTYMVITSTVPMEGRLCQFHFLVDTSVYTGLYREMSDYSRSLMDEAERDGLTELYNKAKFKELCASLFQNQDSLAVFNLDVNNLKEMNDTYGHEAGDRLILKAAESLRLVEAENVFAFRVGGDEFLLVALGVDREEAGELKRRWEEGLARLNEREDGVTCIIACGMAYASRGYRLEEVLSEADRLMYEDKKTKKIAAGEEPGRR